MSFFEDFKDDGLSLLDAYMEDFAMLYKVPVSDGLGGVISRWQEGAIIKASLTCNNSTESRIGEAQGATAIYTIFTSKSINLQYHEVLKRLSDGKIFRVTSDGTDNKTPDDSETDKAKDKAAKLNLRCVSAEEWELPQNE